MVTLPIRVSNQRLFDETERVRQEDAMNHTLSLKQLRSFQRKRTAKGGSGSRTCLRPKLAYVRVLIPFILNK